MGLSDLAFSALCGLDSTAPAASRDDDEGLFCIDFSKVLLDLDVLKVLLELLDSLGRP